MRLPRAPAVVVACVLGAQVILIGGPAMAQAPGEAGFCGPDSRSRPTTITVRTIPALPQAQIHLDGRQLPGDGRGTFFAERLCAADAVARLSTSDVVTVRPGVRQRFTRWVTSRKNGEVTAVYDVERVVSLAFHRLDGTPVPLEDLDEYVIKSSTGELIRSTARSLWLQSERVVPTPDGLRVKKLYYTVDSVRVDSAEVVYRAQQRFIPAENNAVRVELLYFPLRIATRDSLFGFPIGRAVLLTHPDGRVSRHPLDQGRAFLPALPRGEYKVQVEAAAPVVVHPLALSRPQDVELSVMSWLDLGALATTLALVATALLLVRRPHLRAPLHAVRARPNREVPPAPFRPGRHAATSTRPVQPLPLGPAPEPPPARRPHHTGWPPAGASRPVSAAQTPLGWPEHARPVGCRPTCTAARGAHSPGCRRTSRTDHTASATAEGRG